VITTQPATTGYRFRYKCEGKTAGTIPGVKTDGKKKTVPTFRVENVPKGEKVEISISCITATEPYRVHPHSLVGTNCANGICRITLQKTNSASLQGVGIRCVKRDDFPKCVQERLDLRINPFNVPIDDCDYDAKAVRLAIQGTYGPNNIQIPPIVTGIIRDSKSDSNLTICKIYKCASEARGGEEIIILCEKITKDDIVVQFYEEEDGQIIWEARGDFNANDVHHQFAISLTTPPYRDQNLIGRKEVSVRLLQPSTQETGDPRPFLYKENDEVPTDPKRKRKVASASVSASYATSSQQSTPNAPHGNLKTFHAPQVIPYAASSSQPRNAAQFTPAIEDLLSTPSTSYTSHSPAPIPLVIEQFQQCEEPNGVQEGSVVTQVTDEDIQNNPYLFSFSSELNGDADLLQYLGVESDIAAENLQTFLAHIQVDGKSGKVLKRFAGEKKTTTKSNIRNQKCDSQKED